MIISSLKKPWRRGMSGLQIFIVLPVNSLFPAYVYLDGQINLLRPKRNFIVFVGIKRIEEASYWNGGKEKATGYGIRFGIHPEKLYNSYMVYNDTEIELRCLQVGQTYYFAVDSFNEGGITRGDVIKEDE